MTLVATVPPLILMAHVYRSDAVEKEPPRLLGLLFLCGAASVALAVALEHGGLWLARLALQPRGLGYWAVVCFAVVGLSEEGAKFFALKKASWRHEAFNYRFDAIVYSVFVCMGFALVENFLYLLSDATLAAVLGRGLTAIPGHGAFGVFMGYYYGTAKQYDMAALWAQTEQERRRYARRRRHNLQKAVWMPAVLHGCYDFCLHVDEWSYTVVFVAFILILDIVAVYEIRRTSQYDAPV